MHVSLDGTDFRICEPTPFSRKWFSHKFQGPGIRYQLVVVTFFGRRRGFPFGEWPAIKIAKDLYLHYVANEITLADKGNRHVPQFKQPTNSFEKRVLSRHETLNHRIKQFKALGERWRYSLRKHPKVFHAVINIVQISIDNGENMQ